MSRKANQDSKAPNTATVEETMDANRKVANVTQALADGTIPKGPGVVVGGAPGGPPPQAQVLIDALARKGTHDSPGERPGDPVAKTYTVKNQHLIRGAVGVEVQIKGLPTFLQHGRVVSELTHDIPRLRQQGVMLEENAVAAQEEAGA